MGNINRWIYTCLSFGIILLFCTTTTTAQTYSNYTNLLNAVLNGYDVDVIPRNNLSQALTIDVTGNLWALFDVDVVLGQVSVLFMMNARWTDSQIKWTEADYDGISSLTLPRKRVWTPNMILATPMDFSILGDTWMPVHFTSNGTAIISLGDVVNSRCTFNMKFWPFDKHTCDISFEIFGYSSSDIVLTTSQAENFHASEFQDDNVEWHITESNAFIREHYGITDIVFRIKIERRSGIFIILIVFPLYGLAFLSSFVFILPSEAGERIGMSTTLMLSLTVFLEVISDYIPNTSKPIPLLCVIVTLGVAMSIMCTLMVIVSFHFYNKDDTKPVNGFFVTFVRVFDKRLRVSKVDATSDARGANPANARHRSDVDPTSNRRNNSKKAENFNGTTNPVDANAINSNNVVGTDRDKCFNHSVDNAGAVPDGTKAIDDDLCWKDVSYAIDKACFMMSSVIHCVMIVAFTFYLTLGQNNE